MGVESMWGLMYPDLSTCKFHIRSRTSLGLNTPPAHIMEVKHGLITKGGSWVELGFI